MGVVVNVFNFSLNNHTSLYIFLSRLGGEL